MPRETVNSAEYLVPVEGFSHAVTVKPGAKIVSVSGLTARASDGSIVGVGDAEAQARQIVSQLEAILAEAGATLDDVFQVTTYACDITSWPAVEAAFRASFGLRWPASTFVEVSRLYDSEQLLEMQVLAAVE